MADKRYTDDSNRDNRRIIIEDDYLELLSDDTDNYEDINSDSSNDIYFGKNQNYDSDDIFISKRKNNYNDIYSNTEQQRPVQQRPVQQRPVQQRPVQQRPVQQRPVQQRPVQQQRNTAQQMPQQARPVRRIDNDEISDYDARRGRVSGDNQNTHGKGKRIIAIILALVIAFGAIMFVMAGSVVGKFTKGDPIEHVEGSLISEPHVRNVLLIGADKAKGGASRSDSIMIASVNKKTGRITVVSILRDTHLDVPGHRESKVNAAYAWGGANLLVQTIEQNFGIKIDDYATVDFDMFTALIDGLGGIEVDVTENEADYINNRHSYGREEKPDPVESGENVHLNGYQALWYARIRKLDSDFNRTERQRKVISAIVKDVKGKLNPIGVFGLMSTAQEVAPYIETTLSTTDFWSLMFSLMSCMTKSAGNMDKLLVSAQLPFENTWWYSSQWDGSSISIDKEENREMLYQLLYEETEIPEETDDTVEE